MPNIKLIFSHIAVLIVGFAIGFLLINFTRSATAANATIPFHSPASPNATGSLITLNGQHTAIAVEEDNLVPLQPLMAALGGTATWYEPTREIQITHNLQTISARPNIRSATIDRREITLSTPVRIIEGRAMVTLCFITRYMGLGLGFFNNTVVITTETTDNIPVLVYHHILPDEQNTRMRDNPWVVSAENFAEQMRYLYQNGFYPVTLCDMEHFLFHGRNLPANSVMIHFDDGYYSNFVYAAPIMRQYGMRGQIFIITAEVEALGETQPPMDYDRLIFSAAHTIAAGTDVFECASHSHDLHNRVYGGTETRLAVAMREVIVEDTIRSFDFVTNHRAYVFPQGQYNEYVINALQDAGIVMAFRGGEAFINRDSSPLSLPRFTVYNTTIIEEFRGMVR